MSDSMEEKLSTFPQLDRRQRRVLGVLIEKGMTTPEYYPLTLKALATGCNQKSNRDPVTNLDEDTVLETLDTLQEMGFTGTVHTDGGRAERYRHYLRHRFEITESQLAVMGELLLRGRQQLGELRSRASRMSAIDSLDELREILSSLMQMGAVRSSGDLNRRGIEVDHALYLDKEPESEFGSTHVERSATPLPANDPPQQSPDLSEVEMTSSNQETGESQSELEVLREEMASLKMENQELIELVGRLEETVQRLDEDVSDLKRQLGV